MATPTRTKTGSPSSLDALCAQDAQAAEHQRGAGARVYRAVLDDRVAALFGRPLSILEAIEVELAALAACADTVRPACVAALQKKYPESSRKVIADQVRAIQGMARGALDTLDNNAAHLCDWLLKIKSPPDNASPNLAAAHWASIWPLLDRARGLTSVPEDLASAAQALEALSAQLLATGAPVAVPRGSGPLPETFETAKARGAYRAMSEVDHP